MTCSTGENVRRFDEHGGDIYRNQVVCDFSININPLGMPERVKKVLRESAESWSAYPDPKCQELVLALAGYHDAEPDWILCGNGAADLIYRLVRAVKPRRALLAAPTFSEYERALLEIGCRIDVFELEEKDGFRLDVERLAGKVTAETDLVFLCNPNNPNGDPVGRQEVLYLADACRRAQAVLAVDECFCELLQEPEACSVVYDVKDRQEILVLRAFTKTYAMAGLRLGYVIGSDRQLLNRMRQLGQPWSVSTPAQQAGTAALGEEQSYLDRARALIGVERERMRERLQELGLKVYPSAANFLLFRCPGETGNGLWKQCADRGILIRDCSNYRGLGPGYYRVCVGLPRENEQLLQTLAAVLADRRQRL